MLTFAFLLVGTVLDLALGFLVLFRSYRTALRAALAGLSGLFVAHLWFGWGVVFAKDAGTAFRYHLGLQAIGLLISLGILELSRRFLREHGDGPALRLGGLKVPVYPLAGLGTAAAIGSLWLPGRILPVGVLGSTAMSFGGLAVLVPVMRVLTAVYSLYLLESTYRFAQNYQRRIGRLCFIGLGSLSVFHILYFSKVLLYRELPEHFAQASSVVYGVVYPVILAGFLRYRLGSERISIPRDTLYTSATVFLTGAAFLGVAVTIVAFQRLQLDFTYFDRFLLGFSLCFLAVLVLGSGTMRRRISAWINRHFYSRKYDYQEQFFHLHKTSTSGADVDGAITGLIENMKYSVNVDDAFFFLLNWQDGNFYQHENKEEGTRRGMVISGDSPLARELAADGRPLDLMAEDEAGRARRQAARKEPLVEELRFDGVFAVFIGERLGGILALQGRRGGQAFDSEDLALIDVFSTSIGDALFKNRVLEERIERKQFESFHHVASFIIHDIKNQIATLNLLLKNAETNLGNPAFQASMLASVRSCAANLQGLIDRLAVAPKAQEVKLAPAPLRPLLEEAGLNSGLPALPQVDFALEGRGAATVSMDRQALFFVVRNLINNSLEAMRRGGEPAPRGRLRLGFGSLAEGVPQRLRDLFGGGERFFANYAAWILVEDDGAGMDPDFVRGRLFQPFATTKEKGVGIGLYQCKTLVERMGGKILVHSELGRGTEFCILMGPGRAE